MNQHRRPLLLILVAVIFVSGGYASPIHKPGSHDKVSSYGALLRYISFAPDDWLGGTGNWSNGADWSSGLPSDSSDVVINTGNDYVTLDTNANINSLTLGGNSGSSTLFDDGSTHYSVNIAGALTVNQSGTLTLMGDGITANADSTNAGTINLQLSGLQLNGGFTNSGDIELQSGLPSIQVSGNFSNAGRIIDEELPGIGASLGVGGDMNNSGLISIFALGVNGTLTNHSGASLNAGSLSVGGNLVNAGEIIGAVPGSGFSVSGALINSGTFNLDYATATVGSLNNSGYIHGGILSVRGDALNSGGLGESYYGQPGGQMISVGGTLTNTATGSLQLIGPVSAGAANIVNGGTITLDNITTFEPGSSLYVGNLNNSGTLSLGAEFGGGNQVSVSGMLTNNTGGTFSLGAASDVANVGHIMNAGSISIASGATLTVSGASAPTNALPGFVNTGIVNVASGGTMNSGLTYVQTAGQTTVDGTLRAFGRVAIVNFVGGSVYGNGTIQGPIMSNAAINIGDAPMTVGQMSFMGNYTQEANGSLTFDIAGASLGQYDQLNVSGHAQLNGLMTVDLLHGFVPQIGNNFDIMNFANQSGTFSLVMGLPINGQEHFTLEYNPTNLTLDVVAGPLLGADFGSGASPAGAPLFAVPDDDGATLLASNVASGGASGTTSSRASHSGLSSPTPEPGSLLLLVSGLLCVGYSVRRRMAK